MLTLGSLGAAMMVCRLAQAQTPDSSQNPNPPPYKLVRYDEDYRYLQDPERRADFLDMVKYISFDRNSDWWLTLGGEIRERYEYFANYNWGLGPQDPYGYLLQRYLP